MFGFGDFLRRCNGLSDRSITVLVICMFFFERLVFRFQNLPPLLVSVKRSNILCLIFFQKSLLNFEFRWNFVGVFDVSEELLDPGEDGLHNPLLLLGLQEGDGDDEVDVEDGAVLGVEVQLELVEVPRAEVEARPAEETLHDGVAHTVLNDCIW